MPLALGTVVRAFVTFARPPKEKRFVIIGIKDDHSSYGVVLINSEINLNVNYSPYLVSQHIEVASAGRNYLTHDSFIDCTEIFSIPKSEIDQIIELDQDVIKGNVSKQDFDLIINMIVASDLIKGKIKKRFGVYDQ